MSPGDANQNFAKVHDSGFIFGSIASAILTKFQEKETDRSNVIRQKVSFLAILWLFSHKRAPEDATRITFKNPRMLHFPTYEVVTPC